MIRPTASTCLILLAILLPMSVISQYWQPFPGGNTFIYSYGLPGDSLEHIMAVKADTVVQEGTDSAQTLFRCWRPLKPGAIVFGCSGQPHQGQYAWNQDHFFGKKVLSNPAGDIRFIFSAGDTFLLRGGASVGEAWIWHAGVNAVVDSISFGLVLGVQDSVKHISLSNGGEIRLSKSHGLVLSPVPDEISGQTQLVTADVTLKGVTELGLGMRLPLRLDYFRKEAGMHYITEHVSSNYGLGGSSETITKEYWVDSVSSNDTQIVEYQRVQSIRAYSYYVAGSGSVWGEDTTLLHAETQVFQAGSEAYWAVLPHQWLPDFTNSDWLPIFDDYHIWPSDTTRVFVSGAFYEQFGDSCSGTYGNPFLSLSYLSGFGEWSHAEYGSDFHYTFDVLCMQDSTVLHGDCATLIHVQDDEDSLSSQFNAVWPVPTSGLIHLARENSNVSADVVLVSLEGKILLNAPFPSGERTMDLDLATFNPGIYLLRIEGRGQRSQIVKVVVQR